MRSIQKRLSWLTERNLLILLLILTTAFANYIAMLLTSSIGSVVLIPWGVGMLYCLVRDRNFHRGASFR